MENYDWINNLNIYFSILDKINKYFQIAKTTMEHEEIEDSFYYLCVELLRLVPFVENKKDNSVHIENGDGICLLRKNIPFLIDDFNRILQKEKITFMKIKRIRNKYEHIPHEVNSAFSTGSGAYSGIGFYCKKELIVINTMDLTYIIYDLNKLFDKIRDFVVKITDENIEKLDVFNKHYADRIKEKSFEEYNKKYVRIPKTELL